MNNLQVYIKPGMSKQHGALTLAVSMTILMLSTLVTFNVSRAILMEQKITNNDTRAKYAFEAAEAGMNAAVDYITTDPDRNGDGVLDPLVFDLVTDADNLGDSNTTTVGSSTVTVTLTDISGNMTQVRIVSVGALWMNFQSREYGLFVNSHIYCLLLKSTSYTSAFGHFGVLNSNL